MEGTLLNVPSMALSQCYGWTGGKRRVHWDTATRHAPALINRLLDTGWPRDCLININFPAIPAEEVKGIRVTRQGFHDYGRGSIVEGTDPRGYRYFWFGLHGIEHSLGHDSDLEAIDDTYISVTPLQLDLTHDASLAALRSAYAT